MKPNRPQLLLRRVLKWIAESLPRISIGTEAMKAPGRKLVLNGRIVNIDQR